VGWVVQEIGMVGGPREDGMLLRAGLVDSLRGRGVGGWMDESAWIWPGVGMVWEGVG